MEGDSPVALDPGWQFDYNPMGLSRDLDVSNKTSGFPIDHQIPGKAESREFNETRTSVPIRHQHSRSMASIDSVVEHGVHDSSKGNGARKRTDSSTNYGVGMPPGLEDPDNAPAWVELKTKAGKERKRLPLACIACRRKKIKCSGEKPACKHCLKARTPCVYKVTTRKAAPRTDYMAMLDKRLKRMEDRVIKIIPKEDLPDTSQRSSVRPPIPGTLSKSDDKNEPHSKRSAEEAFDNEMQTWAKARTGSTQLDGAARIRTSRETDNKLFTEGVDALPPPAIQEHLAEVFFDCVYGQAYLLLHKPSFMRKLKAGSVPPVLILAVCAISARFSTHPQVSTEPAFLRGEQWATPARTITEKRHGEPNITILTCMVILGLHYFGTCEGGLSWSFGGQAMRMGYALQLHKELDHDSLGAAQAERAAASGKPVPKISQLSFTDREIRRRTMWACYLMDTFNSSGTERPAFLNEDYFFIQLPIKESHFQMEISGATEDLEGHVPLQAARNTLNEPLPAIKSNMGVGAYIVKAVVIWKRVVKYLNLGGRDKDSHPIWDPLSQFAGLQRQISQLKLSLPPSLVYNPENLQTHVTDRLANQFIFLHIIIAQVSLFLHRFAIPTAPNTHRPYPSNTPKSFLATAATTVLDAASQISKLVADSTGHTLTAPFAGYCAYASATVHVWGIFSKNVMLENTSRENLRHNYKYLNRMKRYWGMFHYMAESIKDIYRMFADSAARASKKQQVKAETTPSGQANANESGALVAEQQSRAASPSAANDLGERPEVKTDGSKSKVFQYGDWFNKYPHGVSEHEWEQSHLPHRSETQKGTEAVMSQQAELQSVEEFFASLSPPSKAEDGPNKKKAARKRGKSTLESAAKIKESVGSDQSRKQSTSSRTQTQSASDTQQQPQGIASNSLWPLANHNFPPLDPNDSTDIDVPMSGLAAGLQSGQGNSAFDLSSPTGYQFPSISGPTSNPQQNSQHQQQQGHAQSPFDYTSPASSSNAGNTNTSSQMNFNFSYTSAVPQLDRQMVFGGNFGIDPTASGATNALNNGALNNFWSNPWDTEIDMDGFSGFNDPSLGLGVTGSKDGDEQNWRKGSGPYQQPASQPQQQRAIGGNSSQNQNMSSTAWFMPFNIEPPSLPPANTSGARLATGNTPGAGLGFDEYAGFDDMMDLREWVPFSPGMNEQQTQHDTAG